MALNDSVTPERPDHVQTTQSVTAASTSASTTSTGSANAAAVQVPGGGTHATVMWDVSGSATITVEASNDGSNWYDVTLDFIDGSTVTQPTAAEVAGASSFIGAEHVRAYVDQNLNEAEVAAKGA